MSAPSGTPVSGAVPLPHIDESTGGDTLPDYEGYEPQTYMDKHVVRHLRHMRDKEYTRNAWRNCKQYSGLYGDCVVKYPVSGVFRCRTELKELKVCINRQMVRQREQAPELTKVPTSDDSTFLDIDTVSRPVFESAVQKPLNAADEKKA